MYLERKSRLVIPKFFRDRVFDYFPDFVVLPDFWSSSISSSDESDINSSNSLSLVGSLLAGFSIFEFLSLDVLLFLILRSLFKRGSLLLSSFSLLLRSWDFPRFLFYKDFFLIIYGALSNGFDDYYYDF